MSLAKGLQRTLELGRRNLLEHAPGILDLGPQVLAAQLALTARQAGSRTQVIAHENRLERKGRHGPLMGLDFNVQRGNGVRDGRLAFRQIVQVVQELRSPAGGPSIPWQT